MDMAPDTGAIMSDIWIADKSTGLAPVSNET